MKNFKEWLLEKDPEIVEEGWGKNLITAGLLGAAGMGMMGKFDKVDNNKNAVVQQDDDTDDEISELGKSHNDLLQAAKRAGVPRSEWNRLRGEKRGGIVITVNGRKVPLNKSEIEHVRSIDQLRRSMGN
jgi:hypothetical protein